MSTHNFTNSVNLYDSSSIDNNNNNNTTELFNNYPNLCSYEQQQYQQQQQQQHQTTPPENQSHVPFQVHKFETAMSNVHGMSDPSHAVFFNHRSSSMPNFHTNTNASQFFESPIIPTNSTQSQFEHHHHPQHQQQFFFQQQHHHHQQQQSSQMNEGDNFHPRHHSFPNPRIYATGHSNSANDNPQHYLRNINNNNNNNNHHQHQQYHLMVQKNNSLDSIFSAMTPPAPPLSSSPPAISNMKADDLSSLPMSSNPSKKRKMSNICYICKETETPEWRKDTNGSITFCNACGLCYAKKIKAERTKLSAQGHSKPSIEVILENSKQSILQQIAEERSKKFEKKLSVENVFKK